jgi:hypothetical protein
VIVERFGKMMGGGYVMCFIVKSLRNCGPWFAELVRFPYSARG